MIGALSILADIAGLHSWLTGIRHGRIHDRLLDELLQTKATVERLSDHLYYVSSVQQVRDITKLQQKQLLDKRTISELLNPLQENLRQDILATAVIATPEKLLKAFNKDPWEVLIDPRPLDRVKKPENPDLFPIIFKHQSVYFIGWQMKGVLPSLFDCEYDPDRGLYIPKYDTKPAEKENKKEISPTHTYNDLKKEPFQGFSDKEAIEYRKKDSYTQNIKDSREQKEEMRVPPFNSYDLRKESYKAFFPEKTVKYREKDYYKSKSTQDSKLTREVYGLIVFSLGVLLFLAILTYHQTDPIFGVSIETKNYEVKNFVGIPGAWIANPIFNYTFGYAALIFPALLIVLGILMMIDQLATARFPRIVILGLLWAFFVSIMMAVPESFRTFGHSVNYYPSGLLGGLASDAISRFLGNFALAVLNVIYFLVLSMVTFNLQLSKVSIAVGLWLLNVYYALPSLYRKILAPPFELLKHLLERLSKVRK